jgi:hypothetical protein
MTNGGNDDENRQGDEKEKDDEIVYPNLILRTLAALPIFLSSRTPDPMHCYQFVTRNNVSASSVAK